MLTWEVLGWEEEMESRNDKYDFHIYNDPIMGYILDIFNVNDENDNTALVDSIKCESLQDAQNQAENYVFVPE